MRFTHFLFFPLLTGGISACSGEVITTPHAAGSSSGSGGATGTAGAGGSGATGAGAGGAATGAGGAGGQGGSEELLGHYMQQQIGNCINTELWLSFEPGGGFLHTTVDRNYCGPHGVFVAKGAYERQGPTLELRWSEAQFQSEELRRFTFAMVDPYLAEPADPTPGYAWTTSALHTKSYARVGGSLSYHRDDRSRSETQAGLWDRSFSADITFDAPLGVPSGPEVCSMTVALEVAVQVDPAKPLSTGKESFTLPCSYDVDPTLPYVKISADGFENPWDGSWSDFLASLGIWEKYPGYVGSVFEAEFRPILYYLPGESGRLFHVLWSSAYQEMKHPPPESVE
jgi:hypothetical protein